MRLGESKTPDRVRLYAIGDVHGCDVMLGEVHETIAVDLAAHPAADYRIIHIGDYTDRGPDSAAVIERLIKLTAADQRVICLFGNHDERLLAFLREAAVGPTYLSDNMGGCETLRSYGVATGGLAISRDYHELSRELAERMPSSHRSFIEDLSLTARFGDYFFCHAGVRPGVALNDQDPEDLIWIRDEFLLDECDHGVVVVHGHTAVERPEVRTNRINIDTGAVFGGPLTCLVLEENGYRFLSTAPMKSLGTGAAIV